MSKRLRLAWIWFCIVVSVAAWGDDKTDLLDLINQLRASLPTPVAALHPNFQLESAAQLHSEDMLDQGYFSHTSLHGRTISDRIKASGFSGSAYGENVAAHTGAPNPSQAFNFWYNSPRHYAIMTNPDYTYAGLGIANGAWAHFSDRNSTVYTLDVGKSRATYTPTPSPRHPPTPTATPVQGWCKVQSDKKVSGLVLYGDKNGSTQDMAGLSGSMAGSTPHPLAHFASNDRWYTGVAALEVLPQRAVPFR